MSSSVSFTHAKEIDKEVAVLEMLAGINAVFVYIHEKTFNKADEETKKILGNAHKKYLIGSTYVFRVNISNSLYLERRDILKNELYINSHFDTEMRKCLAAIECMCGCSRINNSKVLRLPSEGWEELVDMWSCHDREFKHLSKKELAPKKNSIMYSTLYLTIKKDRVPLCIKEDKKENNNEYMQIFYNEIKISISDEMFLFHYLYDLFQTQKTMNITESKKEVVYTLSLFEIVHACKANINPNILQQAPVLALKIFFHTNKISNKISDTKQSDNIPNTKQKEEISRNTSINEYYKDKLIEIIEKNTTGTKIDKNIVSFIFRV